MGILKKFAPSVTVLEIVRNGDTLEVALVVPSFIRWQEIEAMVPDPAVPYTGPNKTKNPDDPDHRQAKNDAYNQRKALLVAEALHEADRFDVPGVDKNELPGKTLEERAEAVEQLDYGIVNAIHGFMWSSLNPEARQKELEARADSFRDV